MVVVGVLARHMLLELDDVAVGDGLGIGRGQDGGSISVNGLCAEGGDGGRSSAGREGESSDASHCGGVGGVVCSLTVMTTDKEQRGLPATKEDVE